MPNLSLMIRQKFKMAFSSDKSKQEFKSQHICYETWNVSHHFLNSMQLTHTNASGRWWTERKYGLCCHKMFALKPTHCFSWVSQETEHPFYFDSWQPWRKCHGQKGMVAVSAVSTGAVILEVLPLIHSTIMHVYYQNHGNICMPAVKNLICHQMPIYDPYLQTCTPAKSQSRFNLCALAAA